MYREPDKMRAILGCLSALLILLPFAVQADEIRSATVDGVKIQAAVGQPAPASETDDQKLLDRASKAPPVRNLYQPPNTPAEAGAITLPVR
jgi:hypothetical protein